MDVEKLREQLKIDEGCVYEIYNDHLGYATFGIGHLVRSDDPENGSPCQTAKPFIQTLRICQRKFNK